jgi:GNAT superfamily N-acetyltransferase
VVRTGVGADAAMLIAMHTRCSDQTIKRRYHAALPFLSPRLAHALLIPDHGQSLVVTCGADMVGIATFARHHAADHGGEYEVGLLVEDRWQRQGLGSRLLRSLARQAACQRIGGLVCYVHPDNGALLATIERAGFRPRVTIVDGLLEVRMSLRALAPSSGRHGRRIPMGELTSALVPLLHQRGELRALHPVADLIDQAVRGGA